MLQIMDCADIFPRKFDIDQSINYFRFDNLYLIEVSSFKTSGSIEKINKFPRLTLIVGDRHQFQDS